VATASNGSEAVTLVHALRPQVVLMDVRMPMMDGIKATRVITAAGTSTKILMMTAFDDDSLVNEAIEAGADGYLVKGTLVADTVQAIRSAVSKPKRA
jgi:DNA-binding NarL/FixJ family response regulator